MTSTIQRLNKLVLQGEKFLRHLEPSLIGVKPAPNKWSKIEILGHLIDSAINNLQRFTEIAFKPKPFVFNNYEQDNLVISNRYQESDLEELLLLWKSLNTRIGNVISSQTEETLAYEVQVPNGEIVDLKFLMTDYVDHLEHHLNQITA